MTKNFKLNWENLIGNISTVNYLKKSIKNQSLPHAMIFSGIEGIGKRLAAEICAAALLCENSVNRNPCGICESCHLVAAYTHPDFYIVSPEEKGTNPNIKISQIREMQKEATLRPSYGVRRVVIIDKAEFLNSAAANCLLKTIEEPPSQTIFILVASKIEALLMTIRSRCVIIRFNKLSEKEIQEALILNGIENEEAKKLSIIANGSLKQALDLKYSDGLELRELALNTLERIFVQNLSNEDIFKIGTQIENWSREKLRSFLLYIQKILRDICFSEFLKLYNPDFAARIHEWNSELSEKTITSMINIGTEYIRRLNSNAKLRLLAEAYLIQLKKVLEADKCRS